MTLDSRKAVLRETAIIAAGQAIGVAAMFLLFAMLKRFDRTVLLGGLIGATLAIGNFFMMAINVTLAADKAASQSVSKGKSMVQTSYAMRLAVIFIVLFVCVKSGMCNVFASVIPMLFVRPTITIAEFFRKPGEQ